jgi:hypothetical protein
MFDIFVVENHRVVGADNNLPTLLSKFFNLLGEVLVILALYNDEDRSAAVSTQEGCILLWQSTL